MKTKNLKAGHYRDQGGHPYKLDYITFFNAYNGTPLVEVVGKTMDRNGQVYTWSREWYATAETNLIPDAAPPKDLL